MLKTIEGVYRDGKVELTGVPKEVRGETRVLVTSLEPQSIDIRARGIEISAAPWAAAPLKSRGLGHSQDARVRRLRCRQRPFTNPVM
jgi:hypothetical protein